MTPDTKIDLANVRNGCIAWAGVLCGEVVAGAQAIASTPVAEDGWFVSLLAGIGVTGWGAASQAAAFALSVCLLADFFWKRFFRRYAERRWPRKFRPRQKRKTDTDFMSTSQIMDLVDK